MDWLILISYVILSYPANVGIIKFINWLYRPEKPTTDRMGAVIMFYLSPMTFPIVVIIFIMCLIEKLSQRKLVSKLNNKIADYLTR
jgi:hypothetical protein